METIKWLGQVNNEIYTSLSVDQRYDLELLAYRQYGEKSSWITLSQVEEEKLSKERKEDAR